MDENEVTQRKPPTKNIWTIPIALVLIIAWFVWSRYWFNVVDLKVSNGVVLVVFKKIGASTYYTRLENWNLYNPEITWSLREETYKNGERYFVTTNHIVHAKFPMSSHEVSCGTHIVKEILTLKATKEWSVHE